MRTVTRRRKIVLTACLAGLPLALAGAGFFYIKFLYRPAATCMRGDCENGAGELHYAGPGAAVLSGTFQNGELEGRGLYSDRKGHRYAGDWRAGKKHGFGRYTYPGGAVYEGQFADDEKHGYGVYRWPDGLEYRGNWRDGEPHGAGTVRLADGVELKGVYDQGVIRTGTGIFVYDDGTRYVGEWRDGKREGLGVLLDEHGGIVYQGRWTNDQQAAEE